MGKKEKINLLYLVPLIALLGSLFFLTPSFTGNTIVNNLEVNNSNFISLILFVLGVTSFVLFKKK